MKLKVLIRHTKENNTDTLFLYNETKTIWLGTVCLEYYMDDPDVAYLHSLLIRPKYRKLGLGAQLLTIAENHAKKLNIKTIYLEPEKSNETYLTKYYKDKGYIESGYDWDEDEGDILIMKKDL